MTEKICRLCLQTVNNYQTIKESSLEILKLNLNICKENVMCIKCVNGLRVFSTITPGRAYPEDETLPLSNLDSGAQLDPEAIETTTNSKSLMETEIKCSFCTKAHGREDLISLRESNENKLLVDMMEQYISEMNLKNTKELLTCKTCVESLDGGLSVILKSLKVEEKIGKYIKIEGTDDKGQVELKKVQQLKFKPILKLEFESFGVNELEDRSNQVQEEYTIMDEAEIKYEREIHNTEVIIKAEDDITWEQNDCDIPDIKSEQSNSNGFQELFIENKSPSQMKKFQCETKWERSPTSHLLNPSEIKRFKCEICSYETKRKFDLKSHLLIHKNPSEIKRFKCEICSYETKRKFDLKSHLLIHKRSSEIEMFKCELCSYEAKRKGRLKRHLLTHKSLFEIKMFKCKLCSYQTKAKNYLKTHLLIHKRPSEIKMFKCELCSYEAKCKSHLNGHLFTHKSPSEIKKFQCQFCSYQTKWKRNLASHLLTHKNPSEIKMFKCEICSYETKRKSDLKRHLLIHKSSSEKEMGKCELCTYEAKEEGHPKTHLLTNESLLEMKMFKCELCLYQTKLKNRLKTHLLIHKSPSEINMFKCELCSYEGKLKSHLKTHILTHRSPSEIEMFKCELCPYEAKRKSHLQ